jgi:hypothetical protein
MEPVGIPSVRSIWRQEIETEEKKLLFIHQNFLQQHEEKCSNGLFQSRT